MATATEIQNHLAQWIDGKISLREFEDWFVPATWNIHLAGDQEAERVSDHPKTYFSERQPAGS
jgi:hypothetical protein